MGWGKARVVLKEAWLATYRRCTTRRYWSNCLGWDSKVVCLLLGRWLVVPGNRRQRRIRQRLYRLPHSLSRRTAPTPKTMSRSCGSCVYYIKWKKDPPAPAKPIKVNGVKLQQLPSGLCEFLDARTKPDWGHTCPHWVGKRYDRNTSKKQTLSEINEDELQLPWTPTNQPNKTGKASNELPAWSGNL